MHIVATFLRNFKKNYKNGLAISPQPPHISAQPPFN